MLELGCHLPPKEMGGLVFRAHFFQNGLTSEVTDGLTSLNLSSEFPGIC